jgi:DNA invertase Pin-like site-specific DNA recombinase
MATFLYSHEESTDLITENKINNQYISEHNLKVTKEIHDTTSTKVHWTDRNIGSVIQHCKKDDNIICYEASYIACSTSQVLEVLNRASDLNINLHFTKYDVSIDNQSKTIETHKLLNLISKIESEFISKRTTQALARRKAAGLPLGRPKGRGNKSLKLDKHREDIEKYLLLGISKASIAKLVHCHPQTLYDWIEKNNLDSNNDLDSSKEESQQKDKDLVDA